MRNQFLQQVSKISKKTKRAIALGLAAVVTVMSVNPMQAVAAGETKPYVDTASGAFVYDADELFGMATHVHLFGNSVTTTVHTHGNVVANTANFNGGIGMHANGDKIDVPNYSEWSYVGTLTNNGGNNECNVVFGTAPSGFACSGTVMTATSAGKAANEAAIASTFTKLKNLCATYAAQGTTNGVVVDITGDWNNRYINTNQTSHTNENVYINISATDWNMYANEIRLLNLDSNTSNTGMVVINIDMNGCTDTDFTCSGAGIKALTNGGELGNREYSTSDFGSCRVLWNFYDSSEDDKVYDGDLTFGCTWFGTILAPGANVTVHAINGNVMGDTVTHTGGESHRLDIIPLTTATQSTPAVVPVENIQLKLDLEGDTTSGLANDAGSGTTYKVYNSETGEEVTSLGEIEAKWDGTTTYIVTLSGQTTSTLPSGEYYFKKADITAGYLDNTTNYGFYVNQYGHVTYKSTDGTYYTTEVQTDVLKKGVSPFIEEVRLSVTLEGADRPNSVNTSSEVEYDVYNEADDTPVAGLSGLEAVWNGSSYVVTIPKTADADSPLDAGGAYYFIRTDSPDNWAGDTANGYDGKYEFSVDSNGAIVYPNKRIEKIES